MIVYFQIHWNQKLPDVKSYQFVNQIKKISLPSLSLSLSSMYVGQHLFMQHWFWRKIPMLLNSKLGNFASTTKWWSSISKFIEIKSNLMSNLISLFIKLRKLVYHLSLSLSLSPACMSGNICSCSIGFDLKFQCWWIPNLAILLLLLNGDCLFPNSLKSKATWWQILSVCLSN